MKKKLSFDDHVILGYFLKTAHVATLRASTLLSKKNGRSKPLFKALNYVNHELGEIRSALDDKLARDYFSKLGEVKLRQRHFGALGRKLTLIKDKKNIFQK